MNGLGVLVIAGTGRREGEHPELPRGVVDIISAGGTRPC